MRKSIVVFAALLAASLPSFAGGVLSFNFSPSTIQGAAGDTVFLGGTLQNTGDADLFLNDFQVQFDSPADLYLTADPNYFFFNVPGVLGVGEFYTGNMFELYLANDLPHELFTGSATIYGGDSPFGDGELGVQSFTVDATAPEPAAVMLAGAGLAAICALRRKRT